MKEKTELLKELVMNWSGYEPHGETKEELISSIKSIAYDLECAIHAKESQLIGMVEKLRIPEC